MDYTYKGCLAAVLLFTLLHGTVIAAEGEPKSIEAPAEPVEGRVVEQFSQGDLKKWNYSKPQENAFYVVHPTVTKGKAPLYVVLHSAGQDVKLAFTGAFTKTKNQQYDVALFHPPVDFYALYLDCRATMPTDWWWGWETMKANPVPYTKSYYPTERRVIDTILWAIKKYDIDPDRVYLAGVSMGGSGSLGLGMIRGDLFAAIQVWVPAGTEHFMFRNQNPISTQTPNAFENKTQVIDPPYLVDLSAPNDDWSKNQGLLIKTASEQRLPLIFGWGPFGHCSDFDQLAKYSPAVACFPWLSIRRNEAYPVFLNASTDQKEPWTQKPGDPQGQINAYFRWKTIEDNSDLIRMELRLTAPGELPVTVNVPDSSTVDLTLRRLQKFKPHSGGNLVWTLNRSGKELQKGTAQVDQSGKWIIPKLVLTKTPAQLKISNQ